MLAIHVPVDVVLFIAEPAMTEESDHWWELSMVVEILT